MQKEFEFNSIVPLQLVDTDVSPSLPTEQPSFCHSSSSIGSLAHGSVAPCSLHW